MTLATGPIKLFTAVIKYVTSYSVTATLVNRGAYPSEAHYGTPSKGTLLALPASTRLGWK
jgi:hypothetical protein